MISEILILCEGYHDRAFWAGALLEHFRCEIVLQNRLRSDPLKHRDDAKGVYHYRTRGGTYVHVYPCTEQPEALRRNSIRFILADKLKARVGQPFELLFVNPDVDTGTIQDRKQALEGWLRESYPAVQESSASTYCLDAGRVALLCWNIADDVVDGLVQDEADRRSIPSQQTLERLACTALCACYPGRGRTYRPSLRHECIRRRVTCTRRSPCRTWLAGTPTRAPLTSSISDCGKSRRLEMSSCECWPSSQCGHSSRAR